ncbi:MAG: WbqC family protein [Dysgonamonadaceae bacterium]|jgi:hypothetical protein|nr:WbqC family protein [Dysgonamonadaceae bacterium]
MIVNSLYLAPIEYYSTLFRAEQAVIEIHDNYQKQSYRNRCMIAGANGAISLSIPIEKPSTAKCKMKDIRISEHGNWQHLHWNAIISAYNSTPFFEYYEDDFRPFYEKKQSFLHDFNEELRQLICRLIGIQTLVSYSETYIQTIPDTASDFREIIHPKKPSIVDTPVYYQVFAEKNGFIPHLSIIDLLFNMGNESRFCLNCDFE